METKPRVLGLLRGLCLFLCLTSFAPGAWAALSLAQVPLFLGNGVEPNIVFVLDDSGSMTWSFLPDGINADDGTNRARSSSYNQVYFDPAVSYLPPVNENGVSLGSSVFTAAWEDGYAKTGSANLASAYVMTWDDQLGMYSRFSAGSNKANYFTYSNAMGCAPTNDACYNETVVSPTSGVFRFRPELGGVAPGCPDPADATIAACNSADERVNFANWYSYYRKRIYAAKAGVGRAFQSQGAGVRVGYGQINTPAVLQRGVRVFQDGPSPAPAYKKQFYDWLYARTASGGTPLRRALDAVGAYYEDTSATGPWSSTPGAAGGSDYSCRQSYTVLMTDGYWNSKAASNTKARDNNDGSTTNSVTISNPSGPNYTYSPTAPFSDGYNNNLADVAMYYWKRDLRTDLINDVPTNSVDDAFWQHMVTFGVAFGVTGTIDPTTAFNAIPSGAVINWPLAVEGSGPALIDDLLHASVNGHGGFFSARDPQAFSQALSDTLSNIARRSATATAIAGNSGSTSAGSAIYQASFNSADWSGTLKAFPLLANGAVGAAAWDAATALPSPSARTILSYVPGIGGIDFQWANLSAAQKTALNTLASVGDGQGVDRLAYLRGERTKEIAHGGAFRTRGGALGDIINSDPYYVQSQDFAFRALPGAEGTDYLAFRSSTAYRSRPPMVYAGGNDGMLHGFDADTGVERFAYVPNAVYANLSRLTDPGYTHQYFVDAPSRAVDAYIGASGNKWRTVLLGATGAGGKSVFALDVTQPASVNASKVLWEFTHAELGYTIGQPSIIRLQSGDWAAVFSNGYNSTSAKAQLFIVRLRDGVLLKLLDTQVGSAAAPNGLATPVPVDVNGDRITDYIYAGDLQGNLWKFDVSGPTASTWTVAYGPAASPDPLFRACDAPTCTTLNRQAITARPVVGAHPNGGVMVYVGTGKYIETTDAVIPATAQIQSFYGVHDAGAPVTGRGALQEQTIDLEQTASLAGTTFAIRKTSQNPVDYTTQSGWYMDLAPPPGTTGTGERVISQALLRYGRVIFVSVVPSTNPCDAGGQSWLMELDALSGNRLNYAVFDTNGDGRIDSLDIPVSGKGSDGFSKEPYIAKDAGDRAKEYKYQGGQGGNVNVTVEAGGGAFTGRQSWRELHR